MLNTFRGAVQAQFKLRKIDVLPDAVMWYLKATTLPTDLMIECSAKKEIPALLECLKQHNTATMYDELLEIIQDKIDTFKTPIREDKALLESGATSPQRKVMIQARMHRKMILTHNFRLVTKLAAAAGGKATPTFTDEL